MTHSQLKKDFNEANRLWFYEGYTTKAIEKYEDVLRRSGNDPVIAFQLAFAYCAAGKKDEAKHCLALVEQYRQRLGEVGVERLDMLRLQCEAEKTLTVASSIQGWDLDIEQLERKNLSSSEWLRVALAAKKMGLYGVAHRAYQFSEMGLIDFDLVRDEQDVHNQIEEQLNFLKDMRKELSR